MALATGPSPQQLFPKQKKGENREAINTASFLNLTTAALVLFLLQCASRGITRHNGSRFERAHCLSEVPSAHRRDRCFRAALIRQRPGHNSYSHNGHISMLMQDAFKCCFNTKTQTISYIDSG